VSDQQELKWLKDHKRKAAGTLDESGKKSFRRNMMVINGQLCLQQADMEYSIALQRIRSHFIISLLSCLGQLGPPVRFIFRSGLCKFSIPKRPLLQSPGLPFTPFCTFSDEIFVEGTVSQQNVLCSSQDCVVTLKSRLVILFKSSFKVSARIWDGVFVVSI